MSSFRVFAGTDVGLRDNNEDNFTVCPDLTLDEWNVPTSQKETIYLGNRGSMMVIADGMGGMNAGEVASDIAIKTVQAMFSPSKMAEDVMKSPDSIKAYIRKTIVEADHQVKKHCKKNPSTEGMGSTIVMAWLYGGSVYVGWLGDSRAYSYISETGIKRLSRDHSYVQELVDAKMITEEEAMIHPQSNIITRSLGDVTQKANPDVISHPVSKDEIILICSDGLCGVCSDETIAEIISQTSNDLRNCKETLTNAALEAGGSDNITIALMQIVTTPLEITGEVWFYRKFKKRLWLTWKNILFFMFSLALLVVLVVTSYKSCCIHQPKHQLQDSIKSKGSASNGSSNVTKTKGYSTKLGRPLDNKKSQISMEKYTKGQNEAIISTADKETVQSQLTSSPADNIILVKDTTNKH